MADRTGAARPGHQSHYAFAIYDEEHHHQGEQEGLPPVCILSLSYSHIVSAN
jgi:hypothetical protein